MKTSHWIPRQGITVAIALVWLVGFAFQSAAQERTAKTASMVIVNLTGTVEYQAAAGGDWKPAQLRQTLQPGDGLRTGRNSRVEVQMGDGSIQRYFELSTLRLQAPAKPGDAPAPSLERGRGFILNRDRQLQNRFGTPSVSGAIRGTEFHFAVDDNGRTVVSLLDGEIDLNNAQGQLTIKSGEEAVVDPGRGPAKTALLNANNIIQWCLYYPGVLDVKELELDSATSGRLAESLTAYRAGDLLKALAALPGEPANIPDAERVYRAAALLAVGNVPAAEEKLKGVTSGGRPAALAAALRHLMATVKGSKEQRAVKAELATEWLVESYNLQARARLEEALRAARTAAEKSPDFGFAWARIAELEFGFARTSAALAALEKALALSPRNAAALSLKGFLLAAEGKRPAALDWFEQAIAVDGGLANAWLGRGLVFIRDGKLKQGRSDLMMAAALEPQRAILRSYLAKAFTENGETVLANREINLARKLDPADPTAPFYSALQLHQQNRVNEAITDLEKSRDLNDNRSVYRSSLLLDQDRAMRSANLAALYRDAGLSEVGVREAARAVESDYGNYSAHLFLANTYSDLRAAQGINLRYESPSITEYLLYSLLVPVGGGSLSRNISQQEYSRFFERDGVGVLSLTDYASQGSWQQSGSVYGHSGRLGYAVDTYYSNDRGFRPNQDIDQLSYSAQFKVQLTPRDTVFFQAIYGDTSAGDLVQYFNQASANTTIRTRESVNPILLAGFAHEWSPESRTLFLAGRLSDRVKITNPTDQAIIGTAAGSAFTPLATINDRLRMTSELEIYTAELQHIWQQANHTWIVGALGQSGEFFTQSRQDSPSLGAFLFPGGVMSDQSVRGDFQRFSVYGYDQWQVFEPLQLTAGLSYDTVRFPQNYRNAPINATEERRSRVSPRAGALWTPWKDTRVRFAYTRALGGVSLDQSFRLEPTQVAGFNQSFRSLIPESFGGSTAAPTFETMQAGVEHRFDTRTYLGVTGERLTSKQARVFAGYAAIFAPPSASPFDLREQQDYVEQSASLYLYQLLGQHWSIGGQYRVSDSDLQITIPQIAGSVSKLNGTLQQVNLFAAFNHPSGFFARGESLWSRQEARGMTPAQPGDDFWQFNLFAGYRFPRRAAEIQAGLLNLTGQDYQLSPVNLYADLPRERTVALRFKFNF